MRCFLGFELAEESRAALRPVLEAARLALAQLAEPGAPGTWVRLVPPENWHATLLFFQDLTDAERGQVWERVTELAARGVWRALNLDWAGLRLWPDARRPSLVCLEAATFPALERWGVAHWLDETPFPKGELHQLQLYRPHISVMRFRQRNGQPTYRAIGERWNRAREAFPALDTGHIRLDRVSLFLSATSRDQPIYPREGTAAIT